MKKFKITERITNIDSESLEKYLKELKNCEPLTSEEEVKLMEKVRKGDSKAVEKLITSNLRFVVSVAKAYQGNGLPLSDLISEGNLGLIKATKKFDGTKGFKFISYAVWWVRQSIMKGISEQGRQIKVPMNKIHMISGVKKAVDYLEKVLGRIPTKKEIAKHLEISEKDIDLELALNPGKLTSLDTTINDDESSTLSEVIENPNSEAADHNLIQESFNKEIESILNNRLSERDSKVVKMVFGINQEYAVPKEVVAEKFGIGTERVRQIIKASIKKLKSVDKLREFIS